MSKHLENLDVASAIRVLLRAFARELAAAMRATADGGAATALVTRVELRGRLQISEPTLRALERSGRLPCVQVTPGARGRRYDVAAVTAALAASPPSPRRVEGLAGVVPLSRARGSR